MADVDRDITVTARLVEGEVVFSMNGNGVGGPENEEIEFDKNKSNGMKKKDRFLVRFNLDDQTGWDLRYVKPKERAMWAKVVSKVDDPCPKQGDKLGQFKAVQRIDDALIVRNNDDDQELIKFALNFIRDDGDDKDPSQYVQYDPIGDNRNGGVGTRRPDIAQIAIATVGVVAVTFFVIRALS